MGLSPKALRIWLEENVEMREISSSNVVIEQGVRFPPLGELKGAFSYNKATGRRIKACVPMHTFGHPCRIDEIVAICNEYNIDVVEDAAESLGSYYKGQHTGTFGKFGTLSFNGNKTITTGGKDDEIAQFLPECSNFLITVGQISSSTIREKIFSKVIQAGGKLPVIISPLAHVSKYATIGEGSVIMHQVLINAGASIGACCIINSKALIEHEANIGDFCHISTASVINGQARVGDRCFIGSNTVVANNTNVIADTIIAAGSQVLKSIEIPGTYIGQPLRKIR